jgi:hypothetical protein
MGRRKQGLKSILGGKRGFNWSRRLPLPNTDDVHAVREAIFAATGRITNITTPVADYEIAKIFKEAFKIRHLTVSALHLSFIRSTLFVNGKLTCNSKTKPMRPSFGLWFATGCRGLAMETLDLAQSRSSLTIWWTADVG